MLFIEVKLKDLFYIINQSQFHLKKIKLMYMITLQRYKRNSWGGEEGGVPLSDRKETENTDTLGSNTEITNCPKIVRKGFSKNVMWLMAQLKCLYTHAHNMGNKHKELETMVQLEKYDLVVITKMW